MTLHTRDVERDVRELSTLLGEVLAEQTSPDALEAEYERSVDVVLDVTGRDRLPPREWIDENLERRNPYVDPLNLLQADLLGREDLTDAERRTLRLTVKGVAAGMKSTG